MTKTEWKDAFTGYLCRLSNSTFEEAEYEAHHASLTQLDKYGEQVDRWQAPESAAQAVLEEWYPREHMPPMADDDDNDATAAV
jgi:hypothetical protein